MFDKLKKFGNLTSAHAMLFISLAATLGLPFIVKLIGEWRFAEIMFSLVVISFFCVFIACLGAVAVRSIEGYMKDLNKKDTNESNQ